MAGTRRAGRGLFMAALLTAAVSLGAKARVEEKAPLYGEYVLVITAFDVSELPASQKGTGSLLQRRLEEVLSRPERRLRTQEELDRYAEAALLAARKDAADKIAAKQGERDALAFKGLPDWKYKKELKRIDRELAELRTELEAASEVPQIDPNPRLKLSKGGTFPVPPLPGEEAAFLETQKADAFVSGRLRDFYGRVYAELHIYGFGWDYGDSLVFSAGDMASAMDELAVRAAGAVSGTAPASIIVRTAPETARVMAEGRLLHDGENTGFNPGTVELAVQADRYVTIRETRELVPGETAEFSYVLTPLSEEILRISMPGAAGNVYLGALYAGRLSGENTLELPIPEGQHRYISVETDDGRSGRGIVTGEVNGNREITVKPAVTAAAEGRSVESLRKKFYGAYGRFWITMPLAFLLYGISDVYLQAYNVSRSPDLYNPASYSYYISRGAMIAAGGFALESIIRLVIYIRAANREAVPLWD